MGGRRWEERQETGAAGGEVIVLRCFLGAALQRDTNLFHLFNGKIFSKKLGVVCGLPTVATDQCLGTVSNRTQCIP